MTERISTNSPFIEQAVVGLREQGVFQQELSGQETAGIMRGVVDGLLSAQDRVKAEIPSMEVVIENNQGRINGAVQVQSPIKATIEINCVLANAQDANRLRLVRRNIQEKANLIARATLRAANIEGKARELLSDPNQALFSALAEQLESKGVNLTSLGLNFRGNTLAVNLE